MAKSDTGKTINADQLAEGYRRYPIDDHGKIRIQEFNVSALTGALAQNGTIGLFWLPPGRKRILPCLSRITCSAFGAARVLDIGHDAYMPRPPSNTPEPANGSAFVSNLDVSAALAAAAWSTVLKYDIYSLDEVLVYATVEGGTMPVGATLSGFMAYVYE